MTIKLCPKQQTCNFKIKFPIHITYKPSSYYEDHTQSNAKWIQNHVFTEHRIHAWLDIDYCYNFIFNLLLSRYQYPESVEHCLSWIQLKNVSWSLTAEEVKTWHGFRVNQVIINIFTPYTHIFYIGSLHDVSSSFEDQNLSWLWRLCCLPTLHFPQIFPRSMSYNKVYLWPPIMCPKFFKFSFLYGSTSSTLFLIFHVNSRVSILSVHDIHITLKLESSQFI